MEITGRGERSESMDELASLDREGAYAAATLTLIDGLAPEEQATTLHHLAELYKLQERPKP
jgi:hypothetical protein